MLFHDKLRTPVTSKNDTVLPARQRANANYKMMTRAALDSASRAPQQAKMVCQPPPRFNAFNDFYF